MRNLSADKMRLGQRRIWIPLDCAKGERGVTARDLVAYAAILDSADNESRRWSATNALVAHRAGFAVKWLPKSLARLVEHGLLLQDEGKPGVAGLSVPRRKQGEAFVRFPVGALWASPTSAPRWTGGDLTLAFRTMLALLSVTDFDNGDPEQVQVIDKPREYVAKVAGLDVSRYDRGLALLASEPWLSGVKGAYRVENHLVKRQPTRWSIRWADADDTFWTPEGKEQAGYDAEVSSERVTPDQQELGKEQAGYDPKVSSERVTRSVLSVERGKEQAGYEVSSERVTRSVLSGIYTDTLLSSNSSHQLLSPPDTLLSSNLPPSPTLSPRGGETKNAEPVSSSSEQSAKSLTAAAAEDNSMIVSFLDSLREVSPSLGERLRRELNTNWKADRSVQRRERLQVWLTDTAKRLTLQQIASEAVRRCEGAGEIRTLLGFLPSLDLHEQSPTEAAPNRNSPQFAPTWKNSIVERDAQTDWASVAADWKANF